MQSVVIARTGIRVSRFGYGTGSLHRMFAARHRRRLLEAAADLGFTHFDTSPYYGYGLAEHDLGSFLRGRRARFTVATKIGLYPRGTAARSAAAVWLRKAAGSVAPAIALPVASFDIGRARQSLHASLQRLRSDFVDFLFLHEPDPASMNRDDILAWLQAERQAGRVRAWGVAGVAASVVPFLDDRDGLAEVVQTRDSLAAREADCVTDAGRRLDFTYGYFGSAAYSNTGTAADPASVLARNASGCILVSSHRIGRLATLVEAAA